MNRNAVKSPCVSDRVLSICIHTKKIKCACAYSLHGVQSKQKSFSNQYASSSLISTNNLLGYHRNRKSLQLSSQSALKSSSNTKNNNINNNNNNYNNIHNNRFYDNTNTNKNSQNLKSYVGDTSPNSQQQQQQHGTFSIITPTSTTTKSTSQTQGAQQTWSYHVLPSLYSVYQKVSNENLATY